MFEPISKYTLMANLENNMYFIRDNQVKDAIYRTKICYDFDIPLILRKMEWNWTSSSLTSPPLLVFKPYFYFDSIEDFKKEFVEYLI